MTRRTSRPQPRGALSGPEVLQLIHRREDPLVIMPPMLGEDELQHSNSIDLSLGYEFIVMRRAELALLNFGADMDRILRRFYEPTYVGLAEEFVLHPGDLILGSTFEYVRLPKDVTAYLIGRSSWGRLGLIIATATLVHPGYIGCPTLELINDGNIPIPLFPGAPTGIAQMSLHWVGKTQGRYSGRYSSDWVGPTGPGYSKIHVDGVIARWVSYCRERRDSASWPSNSGDENGTKSKV